MHRAAADVGNQVATLYHKPLATGHRELDDDDEFTSVLSSSLLSTGSMVSAPSSDSTDVLSYLETLKGYSEWTEEVKSFRRAVVRKELRRRAQSSQMVADDLSAKLREAKVLRGLRNSGGRHASGSAVTASGADSLCSSGLYGSAEEGSFCGSKLGEEGSFCGSKLREDANESQRDLWERRLVMFMEGSAQEQDSFELGLFQTSAHSAAAKRTCDFARQERRWELLRAKTDAAAKEDVSLPGADKPRSAQDMWLQRLRLYYDNAEASLSCQGSKVSYSTLRENDDDSEERSEVPEGSKISQDATRVAPASSLQDAGQEVDWGSKEVGDHFAGKHRSRINFCRSLLPLGMTLLGVPLLAALLELYGT